MLFHVFAQSVVVIKSYLSVFSHIIFSEFKSEELIKMVILVEKTTRRYKSAQRVIVARITLAAV